MLAVQHIDLDDSETALLIKAFAAPQDHASVARYPSARRREQGLATRALVRSMLQGKTSRAGASWALDNDASGKPRARTSDGDEPFQISMSHSRTIVACAITDEGTIGVDVEDMEPGREFEAIAAASFGPLEIKTVEHDGLAAFYRIWTLREALAKARGVGYPLLVDRQDYVAGVPTDNEWRAVIAGSEVLFRFRQIDASRVIAVALCPHFNSGRA
jgi:4'-phosphopantetheinyl transferase